jgi:hypothetical protein
VERNDDANVSNKDIGENESGELVKDLHKFGEPILESFKIVKLN